MAVSGGTVALNCGAKMPVIGLGTYEISTEDVKTAVEAALDAGYRHFDCAFGYENEREVGEAINRGITGRKIRREDIFVTTKLSPTYYKRVREGFQISLDRLNLGYIDLYLLHWPFAFQYVSPGEMFPKDEGGVLLIDESIHYTEAWHEMEKLKNEGLVKAIGICNFNEFQINKLFESATIPPAVHQFEIHPYLDQERLFRFSKSKGLAVTGYSPLGAPGRPWAKSGDPNLLHEPLIENIAKKHGKTPAQVLIRYQLQRGVVVIPKSSNPERIRSNFEVFDFNLDTSDIGAIRSLDKDFRECTIRVAARHKCYPFRKDYSE